MISMMQWGQIWATKNSVPNVLLTTPVLCASLQLHSIDSILGIYLIFGVSPNIPVTYSHTLNELFILAHLIYIQENPFKANHKGGIHV